MNKISATDSKRDYHWLRMTQEKLVHITFLLGCYSTSTTLGAGPDISTFRVARSRPELWSILCAGVQRRAGCTATLSTLEQK